jgi:hypothetical protein
MDDENNELDESVQRPLNPKLTDTHPPYRDELMFSKSQMRSENEKYAESLCMNDNRLILFADSENVKGSSDSEDLEAFSPLKVTKNKEQSSKNDIWTNAVMTEIDRESEVSSSTFLNARVNISVSRNHLKLNIILRIIMLLVLICTVGFLPWLRNKDCNKTGFNHI